MQGSLRICSSCHYCSWWVLVLNNISRRINWVVNGDNKKISWLKKNPKKHLLLVPFQIHLSNWTDSCHVLKRTGLVIFPLYRSSRINIASGSQPLNLAQQISMSKMKRYSWHNTSVFPHMMKCCVDYCVWSLWGCIYHLNCKEAQMQLLRLRNFATTSTLFD